VVVMKSSIFWDTTTCSPLKVDQRSSETSDDFQRTTWRYIPEDRTLQLVLSETGHHSCLVHTSVCEQTQVTFLYKKVLFKRRTP
jgi:hypothetical protein